jgi:hypothetical protein
MWWYQRRFDKASWKSIWNWLGFCWKYNQKHWNLYVDTNNSIYQKLWAARHGEVNKNIAPLAIKLNFFTIYFVTKKWMYNQFIEVLLMNIETHTNHLMLQIFITMKRTETYTYEKGNYQITLLLIIFSVIHLFAHVV